MSQKDLLAHIAARFRTHLGARSLRRYALFFAAKLRGINRTRRLGQRPLWVRDLTTSALPPKTDIARQMRFIVLSPTTRRSILLIRSPNLGLSENFLFPLPGRLIQPLRACGYSSPNIRATLSRHTVTNVTHEAGPKPIQRQSSAGIDVGHKRKGAEQFRRRQSGPSTRELWSGGRRRARHRR
jgi:hypothetical protein